MKFAVIGTNAITDRFLKAAMQIPDFELAAVYSRTIETGRTFAERYRVSKVFTNLEEMAKSSFIECVYIASPNSFHKEQAILFLTNKKNVLCEKSFGSNSKDITEMIQASVNNNVILMEAFKPAYTPVFTAIQESLPEIGKVRHFMSSYCQYSSRYDNYKKGYIQNAFKTEFSNGALMDIGVYTIGFMTRLFGKPDEIKSMGIMLESGVDGFGNTIVKYSNGMTGTYVYSKISNSNMECNIQGEDGTIYFDSVNTPTNARIVYRDKRLEDISKQTCEDEMIYETKEFIRLIKENNRSKCNAYLDYSLKTIQIMDEIRDQIGLVFPADN